MALNIEVFELLKERKLKISTAESITGGKIISYLIEVSGASKIIEQSYVLYSKKAKIDVLGVENKIIDDFGVVSQEVALEMARNLKVISKADIAISTTGEAGPTLNEEDVAKGTVCFALVYKDKEFTFKKIFSGERMEIIQASVNFILSEVLKVVQ